jgi:hypothetical protein
MILASTRGVNAGERSSDRLQRAEAYLLFSNVMGILGLHRAARSYGRLADACIPADLPAAQRMVPNELRSLYLGSVAELAEAEMRIVEMLAASQAIGDERHLREALSLLGIVTLMRGEADQSRHYRDSFFERAMQANDSQTQCWAWIERAEHDLRRGELQAAIDGFTTATALLGTVSSTERAWIAGQLAQAHWQSGDRVKARETAANGLADLTKAPPTGFYALEGCAGIADIFLNLAEEPAATADDRRQAANAIKRLATFARSFPIGQSRLLLAQARLTALSGNPGKGRHFARKALEEAKRLALPWDTALAEYHLARLSDGSARRAHLESAAAGFSSAGAPKMAAQVREAMAAA